MALQPSEAYQCDCGEYGRLKELDGVLIVEGAVLVPNNSDELKARLAEWEDVFGAENAHDAIVGAGNPLLGPAKRLIFRLDAQIKELEAAFDNIAGPFEVALETLDQDALEAKAAALWLASLPPHTKVPNWIDGVINDDKRVRAKLDELEPGWDADL